mmetsp:Transcript_64557/g.102370  ORF Transcript_64557/g.102370 Transcript_64557/m.102370 type:complete len:89 (-) Transcript_64557:130-396(-)
MLTGWTASWTSSTQTRTAESRGRPSRSGIVRTLLKKLYWLLLLNWYAQVVDFSLDNMEELFDAMLPGTAGKVVLDFSYTTSVWLLPAC